MEYQLVSATEPAVFNDRVKFWIDRGFKPHGSATVAISIDHRGSLVVIHAQAMVKE